MEVRVLTQMDRCSGNSDYVLLRVTPVKIALDEADRLALSVESFINQKLGRDAVRVEALIRKS